MQLSSTLTRMMAGFPKPSWLTRKHYLFNAHIHKNLLNAIRENATNDTKDGEFKQERLLRRVGKRTSPETFDGLAGVNVAAYGDQSNFRHMQDTYRDIRR